MDAGPTSSLAPLAAEGGLPACDLMVGPQKRYWADRTVRYVLFCAALFSFLVTTGIVAVLLFDSIPFFHKVTLRQFLTDTLWVPGIDPPRYGIISLVLGTIVTTGIALAVALPMGTMIAIYLSEYAPFALREVIKPVLELLSAVPTVVYGYFALLTVAPLLQAVISDLPIQSMLSAGVVMGIMIIPYVSSLSEDAMRSVPMLLREGAYALGANKMITSIKVVYPAALSGIGAAYILGISRAIGETMIVTIAAGTESKLTVNPTDPGATITAGIVEVIKGDAARGSTEYQAIFAAGLTLFLMTLGFNIIGHILRKRFREAY
jgi:phosphate transport system permease protein